MKVKEYKIKKHMVVVSRIYLQAWMKEERDKTWGRGDLPTLPGLYLSTFQPSQRGFFRVHSTCVWRERETEPEF
jgi:hypothetical protein